MEAQKDCLVRAISKDGFVNAVAVYTRGLTERARGLFDDGQRTQG